MVKALILLILLTLSLSASAVNYLSFGGGNYIYSEQGNLYFNFDQYVFDNRKWTYDGQKFTSQITVKMDLKTKYTSEDWFEQVLANKKSDGLMYANYIKQPFSNRNSGGYQRVFWQWAAAAAAGQASRTASFAAFRAFAARNLGKATNYVALPAFFAFLSADDILCESSGDCKKKYDYTRKVVFPPAQGFGVADFYLTESEFPNIQNVVAERAPRTIQHNSQTYNFANCDKSRCTYLSEDKSRSWSYSFTVVTEQFTTEKLVEDRDLLKYFDEVCKKYPSECINEPTDGRKINDVQLTAGSISGGVSVTGPPYTNPITGEAQQDKVVIGGTSSGIGINSGTNSAWQYTPSLGQSTVDNKVDVTTIARPDLTNTGTAEVAKPNEQTGTKPQVVNPSVPDINIEFPEFTDIAEFCQQNPNALACVEAKEEVKDTDIEIPETKQGLNFSPVSIFANNGVCPAPISVAFLTETLEFKYDQFCTILKYLRGIIIAVCAIMALRILMKEA